MNKYLCFHGIPVGQDLFGGESDREYMSSFYTGATEEEIKFIIEVLPKKNKSFYTYLRGKSVYGNGGRSGSYFAMTACFEGVYCTDVYTLYRLMDIIFQKKILNSVLSSNQGNDKYLVAAFSDKKSDLTECQSMFDAQIEKSFSNDFKPIDSSFSTVVSNTIMKYNIDDVNSPGFFSHLKKDLKVFASLNYSSYDLLFARLSETAKNLSVKTNELADAKAKLNDSLRKSEERDKIASAANESLLQARSQLKSYIEECDKLKRELEQNKTSKGISSAVTKIEQPLSELLSAVHRISPKPIVPERRHNESEQNPIIKNLPLITAVLCVVTFLLVLFIVLRDFKPFDVKDVADDIPNSVEQVMAGNPASSQRVSSSLEKDGNDLLNKDDGPKIDVDSYSDTDSEYFLQKEKTYTANLKCYSQDNVKWEIESGGRIVSPNNGSSVKFIPDGKTKSVVIICRDSKGNELCKRELKLSE